MISDEVIRNTSSHDVLTIKQQSNVGGNRNKPSSFSPTRPMSNYTETVQAKSGLAVIGKGMSNRQTNNRTATI